MNTIVRPIITEKSVKDAEAGKYTFIVARDAEKNAIAQAVHDVFSVDVISVFTRVMKGGRKKVGKKRREIITVAWKKATVVLKDGQKISLFELGENK